MRTLLAIALAGLASGCYRDNPAFGDSASAGGSGSTSATSTAGTTNPSASSRTASGSTSTTASGSDTTGTNGPTASESGDWVTSTGEVLPVLFEDDQWEGEFAAGQTVGLHWFTDALEIEGAANDGSFVSRVFDAEAPVAWSQLRWQAAGPYGRALPDGGESEGYDQGAANMDGIVLLMHLDETDFGEGAPVQDSSGNGRHGVVVGPDLAPQNGKFGGALLDEVVGYIALNDNVADFAPGDEPFTWSVWYRDTDCSFSTIVALDGPANNGGASIFMMCDSTGCEGNGGVVRLAARSDQSGTSVNFCGTTRIDDGQWHHLAMVRDFAANQDSRVTLYVDGQYDVAEERPIPRLNYSGVETMEVGGDDEGMYPGTGDIDEVAIWHRALAPSEVFDLYLRGALRLELQVRACEAEACDAPFSGPEGASERWFTDAEVESGLTFPPLSGRFAQYRVNFATEAPDVTPRLYSVRMQGEYE